MNKYHQKQCISRVSMIYICPETSQYMPGDCLAIPKFNTPKVKNGCVCHRSDINSQWIQTVALSDAWKILNPENFHNNVSTVCHSVDPQISGFAINLPYEFELKTAELNNLPIIQLDIYTMKGRKEVKIGQGRYIIPIKQGRSLMEIKISQEDRADLSCGSIIVENYVCIDQFDQLREVQSVNAEKQLANIKAQQSAQ